jgi:hypothetical protein
VRPAATKGLRALALVVVVIPCTATGIGLLYLVRHAGSLDAGPNVRGALPLQQLAGGEAQPLLRLAIAWLPAGFVAGALGAMVTRLRAAPLAAAVAAETFVILFVAGAAADAIAISDRLAPHLGGQFGRPATWVASALMALGALGGALVARRAQSARAPAASDR